MKCVFYLEGGDRILELNVCVYIYTYIKRHNTKIKCKWENQAKETELRLDESQNEIVRKPDRL